jgi:hypothetical protein
MSRISNFLHFLYNITNCGEPSSSGVTPTENHRKYSFVLSSNIICVIFVFIHTRMTKATT